MKLKAPLFSMLLLSAVWVAAQTQNASPSGSSSTAAQRADRRVTIVHARNSAANSKHNATDAGNCLRQLRTHPGRPRSGLRLSKMPRRAQPLPARRIPSATRAHVLPRRGSGNAITGCLAGSPIAGSYTLTDKSGNAYKLSGNLNAVRTLIGNEVQVTGQEGSGSMSANAQLPEIRQQRVPETPA